MTRESDKAALDIIKTEIAVGRIRGAIRAVGDMAHVEATMASLKLVFERGFDGHCAKAQAISVIVANAICEAPDNVQAALDKVKFDLEGFGDLFVYRGGNHVAVHHKNADRTAPLPERAAIIADGSYIE